MKTILWCALAGLGILVATISVLLLVGLVGSAVQLATGSSLLAALAALATLGASAGAAAGIAVVFLEAQ